MIQDGDTLMRYVIVTIVMLQVFVRPVNFNFNEFTS